MVLWCAEAGMRQMPSVVPSVVPSVDCISRPVLWYRERPLSELSDCAPYASFQASAFSQSSRARALLVMRRNTFVALGSVVVAGWGTMLHFASMPPFVSSVVLPCWRPSKTLPFVQQSAKCPSLTGGRRWLLRLRRNWWRFSGEKNRKQTGCTGRTATELAISGWILLAWPMTR